MLTYFITYNISLIWYMTLLSIVTLVPLLLCIAFFTLAERKIIAAIQRRKGPNIVGYWGLLQPFADGLKLLIKEIIIPYQTIRFLFILAPCITFILSITNWGIIPLYYTEVLADLNYGLLYLYAFSSLSVYGIILAGWVSYSKYPFLGALRSAAQIISYEVSIGLIFTLVAFITHSLNLSDIVFIQENNHMLILFILPIASIFLISIIAETNRAPFDLSEAEAEIVAGYNLEYSSIVFAFFFLGEYSNILLISILYSIIFLGGWMPLITFFSPIFWLELKTICICFLFILIRATLPRYRYDQLMSFCWFVLLPFNLLFIITIVIYFLLNWYTFLHYSVY